MDASLAPGARVTEQSSHRGLRSRLWKYVYVDGVETEKEILHTDSYSASKAIVRVGPAAAEVVNPVLPETPAQTPESTEPAIVEGINGGPGVSPSAETPAPVDPAPVSPAGNPAPVPEETAPPVSPAGPGA